jgi:hypothetical protein
MDGWPRSLGVGPLRIVRAARRSGYVIAIHTALEHFDETRTKDGEPVPARDVDWLLIQGRRRDGRRFTARWRNGKADVAYWWTTLHEATATEPTETILFTSLARSPRHIGFTDLGWMISTWTASPAGTAIPTATRT